MVNQVMISGNIVRRPELKESKSGVHRALFTVVVNTKNRDSEDVKAHFISVTAFGSLAQNIAESFKMGARVLVSGRFDSYSREVFDEDGEAFDLNVLTIIADTVGPDLTWATAEIEKNDKPAGRKATDPYEDDEDEKPVKKAKAKAKKAPVEDDDSDEDDEDEKPVKKAKAKAKKAPVEDDDSDDF